ncbi:putative bifunctional diguanylate cyclase/phosphodiesterase [Glaciecola sp. 1036]|uniref:putative bifunctional diguanylate cyclase/phosphodiesterase n=1 Tax=Alteromonadaceae TaxID=72275 RepID=UPI003D005AE4
MVGRLLLSKIERQQLADRVQLLYANAYTGVFVTIITFSALCYMLFVSSGSYYAISMGIIMLVICLGRLVDIYTTMSNVSDITKHPYKHFAKFGIGLTSSSFLWAVFILTFMARMEIIQLTITAIVLAALAGGAIAVLGAIQRIATMYMSMILLPYSVLAINLSIDGFWLVGILGICYWASMLVSAKKASEFITSTIELTEKNKQLANAIEHEKKQIEHYNFRLEVANNALDNYTQELENKVEKRTEEIYRLSNLDPLTELLNRTALLKHSEKLIKQAEKNNQGIGIFFIDLDSFKDINDGFGHAYGDAVLKKIAQRLSNLPKDTFEICARWGGDEFIVFSLLKDESSPLALAKQLIDIVTEPLSVNGDIINMQASIGVSCYPEHGASAEELIQMADLAMYEQKHHHLAPVVYDGEIAAKHIREQSIRKGLPNAIKQSEFHLVYQPIVNTKTKSIAGFEALIRWQHLGQFIPPTEFIPIAEKSGRINQIGLWVLQQACKEFMQFAKTSQYLSVNVSAIQMLDDYFVENIKQALAIYEMPPSCLQLEITETSVIQSYEQIEDVVREIQSMGVIVAIDDFGTGYSSLRQLQKVEFNTVKIDRCFINRLETKDIAIVSAAYFIAEQLHASTIVEGVESQDQLEKLQQLGINIFQGYYFAKPMEADRITSWQYKDTD